MPKFLTPLLTALFVVVVVGAALLYPWGAGAVEQTDAPYQGEVYDAVVTGQPHQDELTQQWSTPSRLLSGPRAGASIEFTLDNKYANIIAQNDKVKLYMIDTSQTASWAPTTGGAQESEQYFFFDFNRTTPLILFALLYLLVVVAIARFKGLRAILGLGLSFAVIFLFTIPALFAGGNSLLVGLITSALIMFVVLYLAHGFNRKTSVALLGTLLGLGITAVLGLVAVRAFRLTGFDSEQAQMLASTFPAVALTGVLQCGIIVGVLGVLNDVTITQASIVNELYSLDQSISRWEAFKRAMNIGHDHIASTVYTLAFAYLGSMLPTIMWVVTVKEPLFYKLTSEMFVGEIVNTIVGSVGLTLAIPLTTLIATAVYSARPKPLCLRPVL